MARSGTHAQVHFLGEESTLSKTKESEQLWQERMG